VTVTAQFPPRYRGAQRIAHGGMGEIYRATDSTLGRAVAIKVLAERYADDEDVRSRFTREALAAARLAGDPSIVTIFDVGEHGGRPYIVMEYFGGGSVEDRLRNDGPSAAQSLEWLEQAARALDHAHAEGIVHRDVKPGNLLLDREANVHVADFGIARAAGLDSLTMTGTVMGTAGYLAPEQAMGQRAAPASDRYALGVVAFELLTGSRPFEADSVTAEASAHVQAPIPRASERNRNLPVELDEFFERTLAKAPNDRFGSCAELVAALRDALQRAAGKTQPIAVATAPTRPLREREPTPVPPAPPSRGSRSLWPVLLVGLAAAAVAGIAAAAVLTNGDGETAAPPARPTTIVQTVTAQGTTVRETVVTTAPQPEEPPPDEPEPEPTQPTRTTPATAASGNPISLNDQGYELMRAGDYGSALPLLESSVSQLAGSGSITEAYASYNLAFTRFQLGSCDGVTGLLDRSEQVQGRRKEIDSLRKQAKKTCGG
jgi:serine/threonine protein kinase